LSQTVKRLNDQLVRHERAALNLPVTMRS